MFFALAAFLWLPASAHCQLETIPGLEFLQCSIESFGNQTAGDDCSQCCAVEKSQYRPESAGFIAPTPEPIAVMPETTPVIITALPIEVSLGILTAAPPEILSSRHFLSRTALPVRAPSVRS